MSIVDKVSRFNDYVQASLENAMGAIRKIHQTAVEIPVDIGTELGLSRDKADLIKATHERILLKTYGGARSAQIGLGKLAVDQVTELSALLQDLGKSASGAGKKGGAGSKGPVAKKAAARTRAVSGAADKDPPA